MIWAKRPIISRFAMIGFYAERLNGRRLPSFSSLPSIGVLSMELLTKRMIWHHCLVILHKSL